MMLDRRSLIAIAAIILADTTWLYPLFTVGAIVIDLGHPFLPWPLIILAMALAVTTGWVVGWLVQEPTDRGPFQALFGLAAAYLVISLATVDEVFAPLWGARLIGGGYSGREIAGLIFAALAVGFLWYRGIRIVTAGFLSHRLLRSFRTGIIALALVILAELTFGIDAHATVMLVPFFVICLAGMAFARLPPGGSWTGFVGIAVAAVLGGGFILGGIGMVVGGHGLGLLAVGWRYLIDSIIWLLEAVLTPVLGLLFDLIMWIFGNPDLPPRDPKALQLPDLDRWRQNEPMHLPESVDLLTQILKYPMLALLLYLAYRILLWAYRRHAGRLRAALVVDRESIRGEADAANDLINLALGLLPDWMFPGEEPAALRYPQGRPGVTEVYVLYFDLLQAARDQGYQDQESATPRERRLDLENLLPGVPVGRITDCFNAACYGNIATELETVLQLRRDFENAVAAE